MNGPIAYNDKWDKSNKRNNATFHLHVKTKNKINEWIINRLTDTEQRTNRWLPEEKSVGG